MNDIDIVMTDIKTTEIIKKYGFEKDFNKVINKSVTVKESMANVSKKMRKILEKSNEEEARFLYAIFISMLASVIFGLLAGLPKTEKATLFKVLLENDEELMENFKKRNDK